MKTVERHRYLYYPFLCSMKLPEYLEQGIKIFTDSINNIQFIDGLELYGAFKEEKLGVLGTETRGWFKSKKL